MTGLKVVIFFLKLSVALIQIVAVATVTFIIIIIILTREPTAGSPQRMAHGHTPRVPQCHVHCVDMLGM